MSTQFAKMVPVQNYNILEISNCFTLLKRWKVKTCILITSLTFYIEKHERCHCNYCKWV